MKHQHHPWVIGSPSDFTQATVAAFGPAPESQRLVNVETTTEWGYENGRFMCTKMADLMGFCQQFTGMLIKSNKIEPSM